MHTMALKSGNGKIEFKTKNCLQKLAPLTCTRTCFNFISSMHHYEKYTSFWIQLVTIL